MSETPTGPVPSAVPLEVGSGSTPLNLVQKLAITRQAQKAYIKPDMSRLPNSASSVLSRVRSFLPAMAQAQGELETALAQDPGLQASLDVENVDGQDRVVEMNLGLLPNHESDSEEGEAELDVPSKPNHGLAPSEEDWSEDSDPDSPPSPLRPDKDNGFTSDTDSDSTISTSTGSVTSSEDGGEKLVKKSTSMKRPLIQEMKAGTSENSSRSSVSHLGQNDYPSETEESKKARYSMSVLQ